MYQDHPRMLGGDDYTYWKDMLELPLGVCFLVGLTLSIFGGLRSIDVVCFILVPFIALEIFYAFLMTRCIFGGIFFGFVLFFRAWARLAGFSTGILSFLFKKR